MERRTFLKGTIGGFGAFAGMPVSSAGARPGLAPAAAGEQGDFPSDNYQMPDWLHYARTVYFDGYSPPIYPHLKDFDARRLLEVWWRWGEACCDFSRSGFGRTTRARRFQCIPNSGVGT